MSNTFRVNAKCSKYQLNFKFEAGTSRGVMQSRDTFFIVLTSEQFVGIEGWGEAGPLPNLSIDDIPDFTELIKSYCERITAYDIPAHFEEILDFVHHFIPPHLPSIRFAFEMALLDLVHGGRRIVINSPLVEKNHAIPINGLIWMGDKENMLQQVKDKLKQGFNCIKIKIGAIEFDQECALLEFIRNKFSAEEIELRVDANGAFSSDEAIQKLVKLAEYEIHSIEQPIKKGQWTAMAKLCAHSPLPIALDEELIGVFGRDEKHQLLIEINPAFIILKPTLLGGIKETQEWIELATDLNIGWWITSALESNVGLNAIAQYTSGLNPVLPQGLGTGQLYFNNITSPLTIDEGFLAFDLDKKWGNLP
ncbi:o-succinylbenzoate synthase [Pararhodonellum marinum]|uniref:o-succinylbenzoate synthase n=1 Tax=Pararhodonellum marinum TaxID=2755358 RepID=UPI001890720C|nr:o-succinylbenzoate synthase [Pararhodonellum marinum]